MSLKEMVEGWFVKIALKKAAKAAVGVVVSAKVLQEAGLNVDAAKFETWLLAAGSALVSVALNYLKLKTRLGAKLL